MIDEVQVSAVGTPAAGSVPVETDVVLEYVRCLRHHFCCRVMRTTPSGRQQSAILLVLLDAACLLSNRGGLHSYLDIRHLAAITVFPRARLCLHTRRRHDLLLTCTQQPRLVQTLSQLHLGLTGATLPVHTDEAPPSLERLVLRPVEGWRASVPYELVRSLREAALTVASCVTKAATIEVVQGARAGPSTLRTGAVNLSTQDESQASPATAAQRGSPVIARSTASPSEPRTSSSPALSAASRVHPASVPEAQIQLHTKMADEKSGMTILVVSSGGGASSSASSSLSTLMVPVYRSAWRYLWAAATRLPGASCPPTVSVTCVDDTAAGALVISSALFHQTMALFADEQPHAVTLLKQKTSEGHNFDGDVFWASLADTATFEKT